MTPESLKVQAYRRTPKGLVVLIYANQQMTSKRAGRSPPAYTREELFDWITSQPNFQTLFKNWADSGYLKDLSPSVDRKDNDKGYCLNNIQLVTWRENLLNQKKHNKTGQLLQSNSKRIRQLTLEGKEVAVYASIGIAMRALRGSRTGCSNVASAADGRMKTAYGFLWEWA